MMVWVHPDDVPRSPDDYKKIVCAEFPDANTDKELYELVKGLLVHGPCASADEQSPVNPAAPCLTKGLNNKRCDKGYPKHFSKNYAHGENSEPIYQRRSEEDGGFTAKIWVEKLKDYKIVDNRSVVPHNRRMVMKYKAHINIEIVNSCGSIKYLFKYTHKGSDRVIVEDANGNLLHDEVTTYRNARYISSTDAYWNMYEFGMNIMEPSVQKLSLHLPNEQIASFQIEDDLNEVLERCKETHLTAFFELNQIDSEANVHLYTDILKHYSWDSTKKQYKKRRNNLKRTDTDNDAKSDCIGRIPVVSLNCHNKELYYLRILLYNVPGPKSYDDLKTVNINDEKVMCKTFQDACIKLGLVEDNKEIIKTLEEAASFKFAKQFRHCFFTTVVFAMPSGADELFEKFKNSLCEDYIHDAWKNGQCLDQPTEEMVNKALFDLQKLFQSRGLDMHDSKFNLPKPTFIPELESSAPKIIQQELDLLDSNLTKLAMDDYNMMNQEQKAVFDSVIHAIDTKGGVFSIDAPGGSGKTFVISAILNFVRGRGQIALAMASTGIAASIISGGGTVHAKLKMKLYLEEEDIISPMVKEGALKELIKQTKLMIIDEMTMVTRKQVNCIERTLREILDENKPFGGMTIVFLGDWRQCLPVVPRASKAEILYETMKESVVWSENVQTFNLTKNMRLRSENNEDIEVLSEFADYLLRVGEGREKTFPEIGEDMIKIPNEIKSEVETVEEFCDQIFENMKTIVEKGLESDDPTQIWTEWLMERAIICPTNTEAHEINNIMIKKFPGKEEWVYKSFDKVRQEKQEHSYPLEFLNSIEVSSIPPHEIRLKVGCPFMLTTTLDSTNGHINGTRYIVKNLTTRIVHGEIAIGKYKGNQLFVPRIIFHPQDKTIGFEFERKQFPIRSCFALTSNKAQGQTFRRVGLYLKEDFFAHGQLYVAMTLFGKII